ncbi:MAG: mannose-6-phosphate isomerase, class I [Actinomycetota bacterium]|nr:mannose-6-phosphate isomerase, class I [Actinomycetota bacterium]
MQQLQGVVRNYAWGSRSALAELTGRSAPTPQPEAELWLGAHPAGPSALTGAAESATLLGAIEHDPLRQLGDSCRTRFGDRLPFLLKVLAAEEPLSLQAHPNALQAQQGYAEEQRRQVPVDAPERNYRDELHKPELVCALTTFDALVGFRPIEGTVAYLNLLNCPALAEHVAALAAQSHADGLRTLFTAWVTLPNARLHALLADVLAACARLARAGGEFTLEATTVCELGRRYPDDVGVLASLLLNRVRLQPGQALYLPAGNLHAYLGGVAVEVMANSDNVLRGGLTTKHVDVPELLRVLDFTPRDVEVLSGTGEGAERVYHTRASEFVLSCLQLAAHAASTLRPDGPQILLCTAGAAQVRCGDTTVRLSTGGALWVAAGDPAVQVVAEETGAQIFRVRDGLDRR